MLYKVQISLSLLYLQSPPNVWFHRLPLYHSDEGAMPVHFRGLGLQTRSKLSGCSSLPVKSLVSQLSQ